MNHIDSEMVNVIYRAPTARSFTFKVNYRLLYLISSVLVGW